MRCLQSQPEETISEQRNRFATLRLLSDFNTLSSSFQEEELPKRYRRKKKHHHHHSSHGSHGTHLGSHSHMSHRSSHTDVHHHHKKHSRASLADHEDGAELKTRSKELTSGKEKNSKGSGDKQTEESAV
ncbi:Hypp1546 [Branchiostoma lanceolatum]|uniref:Hypp1546 protein n=1 Tax=Branchiostoma lanceolatum TaxID=7740 RepID=A0A8J9ZKW3_BRALA|nr:Hypp1546 [Branchiostoma lanceolatum]